jgi:formylglycine-generating enzyme required for sulfatase activity
MFYRSYDRVTYTDMSYPATVADFYLDKYEITVGRFRQFVNAGMGTQASPPGLGAGVHPLIEGSGWKLAWNASLPATTDALKTALKCDPTYQTWTDTADGGNENRPQNCMSWYEAFAFCAWDGGRLATEAEWNYAAAGGSEQREYPWGSGIDYTKASYECMGDGNTACALTDLIVVGSKPAGNGKWGHADLAGNVWEWTLDWYATYQTPCDNCADLADVSSRVIRGGFFFDLASSLRSANRYANYARDGGYGDGARCARTSL